MTFEFPILFYLLVSFLLVASVARMFQLRRWNAVKEKIESKRLSFKLYKEVLEQSDVTNTDTRNSD